MRIKAGENQARPKPLCRKQANKPPAPASTPPVKPEEEKRNPGWFVKGVSGNPAGKPVGTFHARTLFIRALKKVQHDQHFDLFEEFLKQARVNPTVMVAAVKKLVPDKSEISFGSEEIEAAQARFIAVVAKHVTDPALLAAIAEDLEQAVEEFDQALEGQQQ